MMRLLENERRKSKGERHEQTVGVLLSMEDQPVRYIIGIINDDAGNNSQDSNNEIKNISR